MKALGTFLCWTRVPLGYENVHLLNVYFEPGQTDKVRGQVKRTLEVIDSIIEQNRSARVIVGGDCNGMIGQLSRELPHKGFAPVIQNGVPTHKHGNHLDQMWVRNLEVRDARLADLIEEVSDHKLLTVKVEAVVRIGKVDARDGGAIDATLLPQTTLRKALNDAAMRPVMERWDVGTGPLVSVIP